jgi:hypothetical protein
VSKTAGTKSFLSCLSPREPRKKERQTQPKNGKKTKHKAQRMIANVCGEWGLFHNIKKKKRKSNNQLRMMAFGRMSPKNRGLFFYYP